MSILSNIRDRAVETFIRKNETVQRFGAIQDVFIDSGSRIANVKILLRGESQDTLFRAYYSFEDGDKGTELVFDKLTCDRTWINEALKMFMDGRRLNFPIADYSGETFSGIAGGLAKFFF